MSTVADLDTLLHAWEGRDAGGWADAGRYTELGQRAIAAGQYVIASDILGEGLGAFPDDAPLLYYAALALARSGARGYAMRHVERLLSRTDLEAHLRSEVLRACEKIAFPNEQV